MDSEHNKITVSVIQSSQENMKSALESQSQIFSDNGLNSPGGVVGKLAVVGNLKTMIGKLQSISNQGGIEKPKFDGNSVDKENCAT